MFNYCTKLNELNLEKFDTNNCNSFDSVFAGVNNIKIKINESKNKKLLAKINGDHTIIKP